MSEESFKEAPSKMDIPKYTGVLHLISDTQYGYRFLARVKFQLLFCDFFFLLFYISYLCLYMSFEPTTKKQLTKRSRGRVRGNVRE